MTATIKQVTLAGGGVLGSQIAMQTAFFGFKVTVFDREPALVKDKINKLVPVYAKFFDKSLDHVQTLADAIVYETALAPAVAQADLLIEALPEVLAIKNAFYQSLDTVAPPNLIIASNSSTLVPSQMMAATGRPAQFLALHFANQIWAHNTAEIMGSAHTAPTVVETVVQFAKDIGMIALPVHKEQSGYILNSLLVPFLTSGLRLYANDIADPHTIDKTWMLATGAPMGPFGIVDIVGINTVLNINQASAQAGSAVAAAICQRLTKDFIEQGKMGMQSGQGFYEYPNPAYKNPNFLSNNDQ